MQKPNSDNRGFSLIQALMGVGVTSIVAVGIAAAVTNGMDGLSHARSVNLAEDLSLMTAGVLSDPNYCTKHFAGLVVPGSLPSTLSSNVTLFEITDSGTLSTKALLKKGNKYQNVLNVDGIELTVDSKVGIHRYLGAVALAVKGSGGNKINLQRKIPIHIATDSDKKIIHCSRLAEPSQGTEVGVWSKTCDDFVAKGWPTKEACLKDGRWHLVYEVSAGGSASRGSPSEMIDMINEGATLRVRYFHTGIQGAYDVCNSVAAVGGDIACVIGQRPGVPDWDAKIISPDNSVVYFSNGKVVYNAPNDYMMAKMHWWAKF